MKKHNLTRSQLLTKFCDLKKQYCDVEEVEKDVKELEIYCNLIKRASDATSSELIAAIKQMPVHTQTKEHFQHDDEFFNKLYDIEMWHEF